MSAWIGTVLGVAALIALLSTVAVRAIKNETIGALRENYEAMKGRAEELGAEKDREARERAALAAENATLREQLRHTPRYEDVIKMHQEGMENMNRAAADRQEEFVNMVLEQDERHNAIVAEHYANARLADAKHEEVNRQILAAIEKLADSLEGGVTVNERSARQ